jgi:putative component of toxin-antitoxin plasmid stabilization module
MAGPKSSGQLEPPAPSDPLNTIHWVRGQRAIAFAKLKDGSEPAKHFYESLADDDKDRFDGIFDRLCEHGIFRNDEKFHPDVGEIKCLHRGTSKAFTVSEFKVHTGPGYRIFAVRERDTYVLSHGCNKPKKKQFKFEIDRAGRIYCEDRDRRLLTMLKKGS